MRASRLMIGPSESVPSTRFCKGFAVEHTYGKIKGLNDYIFGIVSIEHVLM